MPSGKVHGTVGLLLGVVLFHDPVHMVIAGAGALLPDSDIRHSPAGKIVPLWWFLPHRHWLTHSLLSVGLSVSLWSLDSPSMALAFGAGHLSHVLLDSFTPRGCPLFYPYSKKYFFRHRPPTRKKRVVR